MAHNGTYNGSTCDCLGWKTKVSSEFDHVGGYLNIFQWDVVAAGVSVVSRFLRERRGKIIADAVCCRQFKDKISV